MDKFGRPAALFREPRREARQARRIQRKKPLSLMRWCVAMVDALTVLDPYMGSGNWRRRRCRWGAKFIGIERGKILRHRRKKDFKTRSA